MFSTIRAATPRIGVPGSVATPFSEGAGAGWEVCCGAAAAADGAGTAAGGAAVVVADTVGVAFDVSAT